MKQENETGSPRSIAPQHAQPALLGTARAESELLRAKEALEANTRELAHSLALMRATLESTSNGILATDEQRRIRTYNEQFVRLWDIPAEVMEAMDHRQVVQYLSRRFADPQQFLARLEEIYASGPAEAFDILELADGRAIERFSKVQYVENRNVGRVWSFSDITRRRQAEETMRDEARLLELLNRTGNTLSSELDLRALLQAITDAATELSGAQFGAFFYNIVDPSGGAYTLYTLTGAPREAFEKLGHPRATPIFAPTFRGEAIVRCDDVLQDPRYGQWPPHHGLPNAHLPVRSYLAVPVVSRSGTVLGGLFFGHSAVGVFSERTERLIAGIAAQAAVAIDNANLYEGAQKAAEERKHLLESERNARAEAERASAMKDEFLATLSHELRTPLSAILGWSQVLRLRTSSPEELRHGLEAIERNARMQAQLIEDLLDMSRITSGKLRLDIQPVDPVTFVEAALETVRPAAEAKSIRLEKRLEAGTGPISGDPHRLQQVAWNLLSNAIKFTPRDGTVRVGLRREGSSVELTVEDSGIGIKPDFLPYVFERFRQADATTTRMFGGLGLGLSIVRRLVELHGGTVRAASAGDGQGSTFAVRLPVDRAYTTAHRPAPKPEPAPTTYDFEHADLAGIKVLVVEDEADARDLARRVLSECRADVLTASTASEAIAAVEKERPDVIVSDIGMPDVDGYELLRRIRALGPERGGRAPAIALTAFARTEDRMRALRAGFLVHVAKPVEPSELVATVASVAGRTGSPLV